MVSPFIWTFFFRKKKWLQFTEKNFKKNICQLLRINGLAIRPNFSNLSPIQAHLSRIKISKPNSSPHSQLSPFQAHIFFSKKNGLGFANRLFQRKCLVVVEYKWAFNQAHFLNVSPIQAQLSGIKIGKPNSSPISQLSPIQAHFFFRKNKWA